MPITEQILLGYGLFLLAAFAVGYVGVIAYGSWLMWQTLKTALHERLPTAPRATVEPVVSTQKHDHR
jgi:hypothetical protein